LTEAVSSRSRNRFEIIAGERRWRAAQLASAARSADRPLDVSDADALEIAIIENVSAKT